MSIQRFQICDRKMLLFPILILVFKFAETFCFIGPIQALVCSGTDSNYDNCTLNGIRTAYQFLLEKKPLLGLPSMNPLIIKSYKDIMNLLGVIDVHMRLKNVNVKGLTNVKFQGFQSNLPKLVFGLNMTVDNLLIKTYYKCLVVWGIIPTILRGHFTGLFKKVIVHAKVKLKRVKKKENVYYQIAALRIQTKIHSPKIKISDKGFYRFLGKLGQYVFNTMPGTSLAVLKQIIIDKEVTMAVRCLINMVLMAAPAKEWIPDYN